jgi:hypothetical protein
MTIKDELLVLRAINTRSILFSFMKNMSKWELLLTIADLDGSPEYGIWNYIEMINTKTENPMTLYAFLKLKIDEGSLLITKSEKKSRKSLILSEELRMELNKFMLMRKTPQLPEVTNITI